MRRASQSHPTAPPDWQTRPLGTIVDRVTDRNVERNQNVLTISAQAGLVSQRDYFSRRVASDEVRGYFLLRQGDFAYNKSYSAGFPVGVIRRLERYREGIVSPLYICFRATAPDIDPGFLKHYFVAGLLDDDIAWIAKEGVRNHGLLNVGVADFFSVDVHLPPLFEQQRIAEILDTLDDVIRETEQLIAKLKQVQQGLQNDLLTRGIDDNGELRDPDRHAEQFKDSPLGRIPREWNVKHLRELSPHLSGRLIVQPHQYFAEEGVPIVFASNIRPGWIDLEGIKRISLAADRRFSHCRVRAGDLLAVRVGVPGMTAVVPTELDGCHFASTMWIRQAESFNSAWLCSCMNSSLIQSQIESANYGSVQTQFNIRDAEYFLFPVPSPNEQVALVERLRAFDDRLNDEATTLNKLRFLKKGLMEDLLRGRVRVTNLSNEAAA